MGIDPTRGFVAFPRGLTDWEWYTEPNTARLFFHLLLTANWQEKQWQGITIHPGELVTSQSQLAKQLGLSVRNVRTALEHLQVTGYLTVKTGSKYSVISINNYTSIVAGDRQSDRQVTGNRQATDNNLTIITNQQANKSSSAAQPTRTKTTTQPLVMEFESSIGKLNGKGKAELAEYADRLGNELVSAVIGRCADLGGRSWAYVRIALQEAEAGKYHSVEDYRKAHPVGSGRNRPVSRPEPGGNDFLTTPMLNLFSFKCGLGCHRYNFELGNVTTATEYNGSRQDLVASANKNQIPIEGALVGIVRAILWAAKNLQGAAVDPDTPISVDWDDSYITDAETRMSQMRDDALSGLLPRYKYLSARYGVSEEDARKLAQEAADENKQPELSFGGV